jgi:hypothetical protein
MEETFLQFVDSQREERMVEILGGGFMKFRGPLDLIEVQGGYGVGVKRFEAQEEAESSIRDRRSVGSTCDIAYQESRVEAPSYCNEHCDIVICNILTGSEPSIMWDTCLEIRKSQGSAYRGF